MNSKQNPAESDRNHNWQRSRTGPGTAATHSSRNDPNARPGFADPPRARSANTSPVSPHTPTMGDRPTSWE